MEEILFFATVLTALGMAACSSSQDSEPTAPGASIQQISLTGKGAFADGTPVNSTSIQYEFILDGANMFQAGVDGCLPTPAHVAGTVIQNASSDSQGDFSVNVPINSLRAAVVRQCAIESLHSSQVEGLTIRASILADDVSCPSYCSAQGTPGAGCVDDCATGNRTILASQSLTADQTLSLLRSGTIEWQQNLVFGGLGPALATGAGPDLQVDGQAAQTSAHITEESYDANSCEVAESCVRAPGLRRLLRFDGTIENLGSSDLVIGSPSQSGLFQMSSCHNVELLKNIMLYELIDPQSGVVVNVDNQDVIGRKQGFCMMDITQVNASAPQGQYNCDNQGITAGWADVYDSALDCQFLDITDVPAGDYTLRLTVNPDGLFQESDYSNNTVDIPVSIPEPSPSPSPSASS